MCVCVAPSGKCVTLGIPFFPSCRRLPESLVREKFRAGGMSFALWNPPWDASDLRLVPSQKLAAARKQIELAPDQVTPTRGTQRKQIELAPDQVGRAADGCYLDRAPASRIGAAGLSSSVTHLMRALNPKPSSSVTLFFPSRWILYGLVLRSDGWHKRCAMPSSSQARDIHSCAFVFRPLSSWPQLVDFLTSDSRFLHALCPGRSRRSRRRPPRIS